MAVYNAKLQAADVKPDNSVLLTIVITYPDTTQVTKQYRYQTTEIITLEQLKARVTEEIRRDLKLKTQLTELAGYVGKSVNISI